MNTTLRRSAVGARLSAWRFMVVAHSKDASSHTNHTRLLLRASSSVHSPIRVKKPRHKPRQSNNQNAQTTHSLKQNHKLIETEQTRLPAATSNNSTMKKNHNKKQPRHPKSVEEPMNQRSNSNNNNNKNDHKRSSNKQYASIRRSHPAYSKKKHPRTSVAVPERNPKHNKKSRLVPVVIPPEQEQDRKKKNDVNHDSDYDYDIMDYEEADEPREPRRKREDSVSLFYNGSHFSNVFVACLPGLEPIVMAQLESILGIIGEEEEDGGSRVEEMAGGVQVTHVSLSELHQFHLQLGCASHILIRLISSSESSPESSLYATQFKELHDKVARYIPWHKVLATWNDGSPPQLDISVTAHKSKLHHTKGIAERIETAIQKSLKREYGALTRRTNKHAKDTTTVPPPRVRLVVRMNRNKCEISLDTSLTPLHRRGYKLATAKAPLREDLAFGLLYGTWWKQSIYDDSNNHHKPHLNDNHRATTTTRLLDPFCGSGTIPIEGAAMLAGLPPGRLRHAPLEGTVWYNPTEWNQLVTNSISNNNNNNTKSLGSKLIGASDRDAGAMTAAKENAKRAGVYDWIDFQHCALKSQPWLMGHKNKTQHNNSDSDNTLSTTEESEEEEKESPLWIVTNPPYGKRIRGSGGGGASSLLPLYQTLGHSIRHFNHVDVALYTQDVTLARRTGIPNINPIFTAPHGGLRVTAMSTTGANTIQTNHDDDETK